MGCARGPSDEQCQVLVERYTEQLIRTLEPNLAEGEIRQRVEEARAQVAEQPWLGRCRTRVSRREYECAMKAPNPDEMEKCLL